jgi:hypothetical protein
MTAYQNCNVDDVVQSMTGSDEDGVTLCASPAGQTINPSGPAHARVSRFRSLDTGKVMPTSDTCGPLFTASSPSAALQSSVENRLRAAMDLNGSLEFALTWRPMDMPSGPPICALRVSERRTTEQDYISWPTPTLSMSQPGPDVSITGQRPDGSHATMSTQAVARRISGLSSRPSKGGDLNPAQTCWLMGFPPAWLDCTPSETQSSRKSRRSSSPPRAKPLGPCPAANGTKA